MTTDALPLHAGRRRPAVRSLPALAAAAALALGCGALGLFIAEAYPIRPAAVATAFAAWFVFAACRPSWSLAGMLALLPVLAFAPRTGWLLAEEFDLLALATAGGGYAAWLVHAATASRADARGDVAKAGLSLVSIALIALFLADSLFALDRGIAAAGAFRADWYEGYDGPLNGLRVLKSFVWALVLLPVVVREARGPHGLSRIGLGLTAGLALGALAVLSERYAFTGLLEFTDDYRVTGSFWEMHLGGAALDAFLAITTPFAIGELLRRRHASIVEPRVVVVAAVLALAAYACLVTFSRAVYAALPISLLVLALLLDRQGLRTQRGAVWPMLLKAATLVALATVAATVVFRHGGYRAALAVYLFFACAVLAEKSARRARAAHWLAAAVVGSAVAYLAGDFALDYAKGPYIVFACALAAFAIGAWFAERDPRPAGPFVALAALVWLGQAAYGAVAYWGGSAARTDTLHVVAALGALVVGARLLPRPLWPEDRGRQVAALGLVGMTIGCVVVFLAGSYMGTRVAASSGDFDSRLVHWEEGLARIRGADQWLFGKGLGRYPATSLFEAPPDQYPGSHHLARRDGTPFVALTAPRVRYLGFGEMYRLLQRLDIAPGGAYHARIEVRSPAPTRLNVEVCERHLIYVYRCALALPKIAPSQDGWQVLDVPLDATGFGNASVIAPKPVFLGLGVEQPGLTVEIRRVALVDASGVDVVKNGDFAKDLAFWFSSSDKWHLPFHLKSIVLDVLFNQGIVGLALFALLVGGAFLRVTVGRARRHPAAPYLAAALAGFLTVGAFDTLLDMPRVAFLFWFVTLLALVIRNPALRAGPDVDAAAAQARQARRRLAFGEGR